MGFDVSFETPIYGENGVAHSIHNGIGTPGVKPVGMPTDWVSSLVVVKKPNGKLKVYIDLKQLNNTSVAIIHFQSLMTQSKAKVFSMCDLQREFGTWS